MDARKDLLLKSAARLYSLGVDLEMARDKLKKLVEQGVPYDSKEMKDAYREFSELDAQWKELEVVFPEECASVFSPEELAALKSCLAQDPRPRYRDDPEKEYGLTFAGRNIRFVVSDGVLTVTQVR